MMSISDDKQADVIDAFNCLWGPPGFTCCISFAPVVQFYLLLSPYLCFISF